MTDVLIRRGNLDTHTDSRDSHTERKAMWGQREKVAICKPRREASEEINPANTLLRLPASRTVKK